MFKHKQYLTSFFVLLFFYYNLYGIVSNSAGILRNKIAFVARSLIGKYGKGSNQPNYTYNGKLYCNDCFGIIRVSYDSIGFDIARQIQKYYNPGRNSIGMLYYYLKNLHHIYRSPRIGDIVFFDNTWDRNHDSKINDPLTHAGIVTKIDKDGTVYFVHHTTHHGIVEDRMNLKERSSYKKAGKVLNNYLRVKRKIDKPGTKYLSGELFHAFGRIIFYPKKK